jgi:SAM-dependent methyltransferase
MADKIERIDYSVYWEKCWAEEDADELYGYLDGWNGYAGTEVEIFKQYNVKWVCDAACGFGAHTLALASNGFEVSAFDISNRAVELTTGALRKYGYNDVEVKVAGLISTGYEDDTFDAVTAYAVIDHLTEEDSVAAVRELMRIIKPEGLVLLSFDMPDEEDFSADHDELPDGSMIYINDSSRNGMIFRPHDSKRIESLVRGYTVVKEWNNRRGDRFVVIQKRDLK